VRLAADDGADLGKLLDRGQPVEPRHQRIVQVRRDRERRQRARKLVVIASIGYFGPGSSEALAAHERADQLSQELGDRKGRFRARFHAKGFANAPRCRSGTWSVTTSAKSPTVSGRDAGVFLRVARECL
jgi:hypothetical protein